MGRGVGRSGGVYVKEGFRSGLWREGKGERMELKKRRGVRGGDWGGMEGGEGWREGREGLM